MVFHLNETLESPPGSTVKSTGLIWGDTTFGASTLSGVVIDSGVILGGWTPILILGALGVLGLAGTTLILGGIGALGAVIPY